MPPFIVSKSSDRAQLECSVIERVFQAQVEQLPTRKMDEPWQFFPFDCEKATFVLRTRGTSVPRRHSVELMAPAQVTFAPPVHFGSKADSRGNQAHVRFTPKSGHRRLKGRCPLCAWSGHPLQSDVGPLAAFISAARRAPDRQANAAARSNGYRYCVSSVDAAAGSDAV